MQTKSVRRTAAVTAVSFTAALMALGGCGRPEDGDGAKNGVPPEPGRTATASGAAAGRTGRPEPAVPVGDPAALPGVGGRLRAAIPADSRQALVVYGEGQDSADATVVLYGLEDDGWRPLGSWSAHNGRNGWTTDHHAGDGRSPVGVFTVTDAGGVLPDPGARLAYTHDRAAYVPPSYWSPAYQHDFDYVIAIDYNRLRGAPPHDATRPWGAGRGGKIWLHLDHGSGTSACIGLPREAMRSLLRTFDPARDPVVVMGDRVNLMAQR
ncbi:L,D-transpeptidase family protein [Streptomyces sp. NPDC093272]|uniref:L,D-transpeptidase family protein n=1 Tax=Streptomyces sp. NPDC093272 TaxID=3154981 RepID=UPI00342A62F5